MVSKLELAAARFLDATYAMSTTDITVEEEKWDAIYDEKLAAHRAYIDARKQQDEDDKHADRSESCRMDAEIDAQQEASESNQSDNG